MVESHSIVVKLYFLMFWNLMVTLTNSKQLVKHVMQAYSFLFGQVELIGNANFSKLLVDM